MQLKKLNIENFGPFSEYEIMYPKDGKVILLTGKNNEGKSNIISALRLLSFASKVVGKRKQRFTIDHHIYYKLLAKDVDGIVIKKLIHNYTDNKAVIKGTFQKGFTLTVHIDPINELIYASYAGEIPNGIEGMFGMVPPLGQLNENEELINNTSHLRTSMNTNLAPRHLRNHFYHFLTDSDYELVKEIVNSSWMGIELLDWEYSFELNRIHCYFSENRFEREISWAGQGFQVWVQIIAHLVRLSNTSILIFDEPEINLHPEKQHDLIKVIEQYFKGTVIIATHSIELMNNVGVDHIIHVKKNSKYPLIKNTQDRQHLDLIRSEIGSNFNLVASQYENFDIIIFTEDKSDFDIITRLAAAHEINLKAFNIPIYGFKQYRSCIYYKRSYDLLMGKNKVNFSLLLDRDYYPAEQLNEIKRELAEEGIKTIFTCGKEIENIFIKEQVLYSFIPHTDQDEFRNFIEKVFQDLYYDCIGSHQKLHKEYYRKLDDKSITTKFNPEFDRVWKNKSDRLNKIAGKEMLKRFRDYVQRKYKKTLTDDRILIELIKLKDPETKLILDNIYQLSSSSEIAI